MTLQALRGGPRALLLALSFVGPLACKSETSVDAYIDQVADDVCEAVIACGCEYPNGALYEHCLGELTVNFDSAAQLNLVDGLSFDGGCADRAATQIEELGCGVFVGEPDAECEKPCKIWHGPVGKGGTCTTANGFDNCKQGLTCGNDGICVDPCAEPKLPEIGEACGFLLGCIDGAYCDADAGLNPICQALPAVGLPCTKDEGLCAAGLYCDSSGPDTQVCTPVPALGEACTFQCAANLFCDTSKMPSVCAAVPTLGEACPFGGCQQPYVCNFEAVCDEPQPQVCGSYGGLPTEDCAAGEFTCGGGACVPVAQVCDGVQQCGDGSDEIDCGGGGCAVDEFACLDTTCIAFDVQCDGTSDCLDGSDEAPFNPFCP